LGFSVQSSARENAGTDLLVGCEQAATGIPERKRTCIDLRLRFMKSGGRKVVVLEHIALFRREKVDGFPRDSDHMKK